MCPIRAARQSVRPSAGQPAAARSVPVGRSCPEPAVPSAACRPSSRGTWPDWIQCASMRRSAHIVLRPRRADVRHGAEQALPPVMNWLRRELAPQLAPSAQAFGGQGGSARRHPSGPRAQARSGRRRTGPAQADRLHQRQESAVKLRIWHAAHRRRAKWQRTESKSILPAQRPRSSAQGRQTAGPADGAEARFERVCGIWCGHRCLLYCCARLYIWGLGFRIMSLAWWS
jgi:hypothetical protein